MEIPNLSLRKLENTKKFSKKQIWIAKTTISIMLLLHSVSDRETYRQRDIQTDSYLVQRERLGGGVLHVPLSVADCE